MLTYAVLVSFLSCITSDKQLYLNKNFSDLSFLSKTDTLKYVNNLSVFQTYFLFKNDIEFPGLIIILNSYLSKSV